MSGSNFTSVALMALYTARANMAAKPSHMRKTALATKWCSNRWQMGVVSFSIWRSDDPFLRVSKLEDWRKRRKQEGLDYQDSQLMTHNITTTTRSHISTTLYISTTLHYHEKNTKKYPTITQPWITTRIHRFEVLKGARHFCIIQFCIIQIP